MEFSFLFDAIRQAFHSDKVIHLSQDAGTYTVLVVMG
jgi:hypothetical protein